MSQGEQGASGGGSSLDHFGLEMQLQQNIFNKRDHLLGDLYELEATTSRGLASGKVARPASAPMRSKPIARSDISVAVAGPSSQQHGTGSSLLGSLPALPGQAPSSSPTRQPTNHLHQQDRSLLSRQPEDAQMEAMLASDEVGSWLAALRLEEWLPKLNDLGVDSLEDILEVSDDDLNKIGMRHLQRRRILHAVEQLDERAALQYATPSKVKVRPASAPGTHSERVKRSSASGGYDADQAAVLRNEWVDDHGGPSSDYSALDDAMALDDEFDFQDLEYIVTIFSGTGGTDAKRNVWIELHGERGDSGPLPLRRDDVVKPFARGMRTEFSVEWPNLGALTMLQIGHDNRGIGAGWEVERVEVALKSDRWVFLCGEVLDTSSGLERVLKPRSPSNPSNLSTR